MKIFDIYNKVRHKITKYDKHYYRTTDAFLKQYFNGGKKLIGIEIGAMSYGHAQSLFYHLPIEKLYLIDPFIQYIGFPDGLTHYPDMENDYKRAVKYVNEMKGKAILIRKKSEDAINDIPDNLDFVYIDGNHEYEYVKKDLELYYPKLRTGGVLCGNDFTPMHLGVVNSVLEFAKDKNLRLSGAMVDYWMIKGESMGNQDKPL